MFFTVISLKYAFLANDHTDILINQRIECYLNNTINLRHLTPHIMPCYTHKMAIVSWPQILWRHFTLCIRHDKITKYSSRCPELRRQNLVTLRSPHSTPQQLLLSSILADHGNRSGILDLLTVPYANHLHLAPNNCVSSSIFTDWVHFGAVVTVQSSEPTTNVPTQLNFLTPKCQSTEGNQACITTHTHLTALFSGLPGWAGTRKVKPIWILLKQETVNGSGISWAICKSATRSRQITMPAPHHSDFYRPDALPAAQPTASKHWRQTGMCYNITETDTKTHWFVEVVRRDTAESLSLDAVLSSETAVLQLSRRPALSLSALQCPAHTQLIQKTE